MAHRLPLCPDLQCPASQIPGRPTQPGCHQCLGRLRFRHHDLDLQLCVLPGNRTYQLGGSSRDLYHGDQVEGNGALVDVCLDCQ